MVVARGFLGKWQKGLSGGLDLLILGFYLFPSVEVEGSRIVT